MSSDDDAPIGEAYILDFISRNEEFPSQPAQKAPISRPDGTPRLRRSTRKLSEPLHKSTFPVKPILKSTVSAPYTSTTPSIKTLPLSLASKKKVPLSVDPVYSKLPNSSTTALYSESDDELFWTPRSLSTIDEDDANDSIANVKRDDYWGNWEKKELPASPPEILVPGRSSAEVSTPLPSPKLRTSFSEKLPSLGYPLVPRNTMRRRALPIVDELDRSRNTIPFPSRTSFDFSVPGIPSPSDFPSPPEHRLSWRPSFPSFTRRSHSEPELLNHDSTQLASKRKSIQVDADADAEIESKRRKVVKFALPAGHGEPPRLKRRLTPYHEPFSAKVKKMLFSLFAPAFDPEIAEEKRMKKERKTKRKKGEKERKGITPITG